MNSSNNQRSSAREVCRNWLNGRCRYGERCRYLHEKSMNQPQEATPAPVAAESVPESPQDDSNSTLSHTVISIAQDLSFNADTFGPRVVKVNRDKGLLFGPVLPNDFTKEYDANTMSFSLKYLMKDLSLLLRLPFNHFLSHLLYDVQFKRTLNSFLQYMPRTYDQKYVPESFKELYDDLFKCLLRLFEDQQGMKNFLKKNTMSITNEISYYALIVKELPLDLSMLMDLSSIYGRENKDSLNKLWKPLLSCPSFTKELTSVKELVCKDCWLIMKSMKSNISEDTYLSYLVLLSDTLSTLNEFVQSYDQSVCYLVSSMEELSMDDPSAEPINLFLVLKRFYAYINNVKIFDTEKSLSLIVQLFITLLYVLCEHQQQSIDLDLFDESIFYSWIVKSHSIQSNVSLDHAITQQDHFHALLVHFKSLFPSNHYRQLLTLLKIDEQKHLQEEAKEEVPITPLTINGQVLSKDEEEELNQVKSIFPDYTDEMIYDYIQQYNHNVHRLIDDILNNRAVLRKRTSSRRKDLLTTKPRTYREVLSEIFSKQEIDELHNLQIGKKIEKDYFHSDVVAEQNDLEHSDEPDCSVDMKKYKQFQARLVKRYEYGDDYDEEDYKNLLPMEDNPNHKTEGILTPGWKGMELLEETDSQPPEKETKEEEEEKEAEVVNDDLPEPEDVQSVYTKSNKQKPQEQGKTKKQSKNSDPKRDKNRIHNNNMKQKENREKQSPAPSPTPSQDPSKSAKDSQKEKNSRPKEYTNKPRKTHGFAHDNHNRKANQQKKMNRAMSQFQE